MDDDNAVAREVHVELETVRTEAQPILKCGDRVLRRERAAAAMGEDERPAGREHPEYW